eukprot:751878-Hanusia_phi.AAC.5
MKTHESEKENSAEAFNGMLQTEVMKIPIQDFSGDLLVGNLVQMSMTEFLYSLTLYGEFFNASMTSKMELS